MWLVRVHGTKFDLASKLVWLHDECHTSLVDTDVMSVLKIPWRKWNLND